MHKLIVVRGYKGSGKTSAIHGAARLLGCGLTDNSPADIFMITCLKLGTTKYRIGIASSGDSAAIIKEHINTLYPLHLDYVIMASSAPVKGDPLIEAFANIEEAELCVVRSEKLENSSISQINDKVSRVSREIRSHIP